VSHEPGGRGAGFQREEPGVRSEAIRSQAIGEPGVYKMDAVIETEQGAGPVKERMLIRTTME